MALAKDRAAITQLTASGTSTTLDVSGSYESTLYVRHSNGTGGSGFTGASIAVQVKPSGGTFITLVTLAASQTAAQLDVFTVRIPDDAVSVELVYTQPSGGTPPTGFTLDAEVGRITSL